MSADDNDEGPDARRAVTGWSWSRRTRVVAGVVGALMACGIALAASNWTVGLAPGSSGEAKSGSVTNITIVAVGTPSPTNSLFPGASGDVVALISNPNNFAVTITGVNLPTNTTYAGGFTDAALTTPQTGCTTSTSLVAWAFATATSGTAHTLTTPIVVAAGDSLTITFTNDATMGAASPAACEATYFSMPSLTSVAATAGSGTTSVMTTDSWTS